MVNELREIYLNEPGWLRLEPADVSRHIPIFYVRDSDWMGRGYIDIELADGECIVYDFDDGSLDYTKLESVYRVGTDHASIPTLCFKSALAGLKPMNSKTWNPEVCTTNAISTVGDFSMRTWLAFLNRAYLSSAIGTLCPYLEEEFDVLKVQKHSHRKIEHGVC